MHTTNQDLFQLRLQNPSPLGKHSNEAKGSFLYPKLEGEVGARMSYQGKEVICWSINNYLGLSNHPAVRKIDTEASKEFGMGAPMGSRLMTGDSVFHDQLEIQLAEFVSKEASMLLNIGYQGIMSVVDALLSRHDAVVYDQEVHACTYDGIRMQRCQRYPFKHNDLDSLELQLKKASAKTQQTGGGILLIVEGVYGMRGHQAKLNEIIALKAKYQFRLLLDDAHGFGVMGKTGAGTDEHQECQEGVDLYFSTFTKSMSTIGAFIAGQAEIVDYLKYSVRSQIFSKTLPMPIVLGAIKRLELIKTQPQLRAQLWSNVYSLQAGLHDAGLDMRVEDSCITPVIFSAPLPETIGMVSDLRDKFGIFTSLVVYPVVPKNMVMMRLIPTAVHTERDIDETLTAFVAVNEKLRKGAYSTSDRSLQVIGA